MASASADMETSLERRLAEYVAADREHLRLRLARAQRRAPGAWMLIYIAAGRIHTCMCADERGAALLARDLGAEVYVSLRSPDDDNLDALD
jgi:hypothetical protein